MSETFVTTMRMDDDAAFEALMQEALDGGAEPAVPAGLQQRMMAWTAQEMTSQFVARPSVQAGFRDFGVLADGQQSRRAFFGSLGLNLAAAVLVVIVGSVVKPVVHAPAVAVNLIAPVPERVPPPPPVIMPRVVVQPPPMVTETPRIETAHVDLPPDVKPVVAPQPKMEMEAPAARRVEAPPAPRAVNLNTASAAAVPNYDVAPSAVRLGRPDSPVSPTGASVASVNLNRGITGMPAGNSGNGLPAKNVILGNGAPGGTNLNGRDASPVAVKGLSTGVQGNIGTTGRGPVVVQIAPAAEAYHPVVRGLVVAPTKKPVITFYPKPVFPEAAKAAHIEGVVDVKVNLRADGTVLVLGIARGLGHGMDESALEAAKKVQFRPAVDAEGKPMDYVATVAVRFQLNEDR